jgi:hypothetical protein
MEPNSNIENQANTPVAPTPEQSQVPQPPSQVLSQEKPASSGALSLLFANKGIIIAAILVIVVAIIGISALLNINSTDQYQGFIQKMEQQTEDLKQTETPISETLPESDLLEEAIPASTTL